MAGLDPTIPLGVKPPDFAGSMSQYGQLGLMRNQLQLGANQVQLSNATLQPSIDQARAQASTAVSQAGTAAQNLSQQELATMRAYYANAIQVGAAIAKDPSVSGPEATGASAQATLTRAIADVLANSGAPTSAYAQAFAGLPDRTKGAQPQDYVRWIAGKLAAATEAATQLDRQFPAAQMVTNNQVIQPQAAGGMVAQTPPGTPMGPPTQIQLPPTQPVMRGNVPGVLGANPAPGFVQTAPALGQAAAVQGTVESNVKHFADVQTAAAAAPMRIAQLQDVKALAPQAVTGDANFKRQVFSKLAGYLGVVFDPTSQTATDELAKAAALLMERSGMGATDAAREVAAMATPNYKMTKEAINSVSNALIGMERRNLAASAYFNGVPQDSPEYGTRLQTWNNIPARDKAFTFMALPADEKMAAAQKMRGTPQGKEIAAGIRAIEALGLK
jgi:hypothetical protein